MSTSEWTVKYVIVESETHEEHIHTNLFPFPDRDDGYGPSIGEMLTAIRGLHGPIPSEHLAILKARHPDDLDS